MSVYVADFKPGDGSWVVVHDDATGGSHSGTMLPTSLVSGDFRSATIVCPVCSGSSSHPIGGGAQPKSAQEMFVRQLIRVGCPCASLTAGKSAFLAIAHARGHVNVLEGNLRWQVGSIVP